MKITDVELQASLADSGENSNSSYKSAKTFYESVCDRLKKKKKSFTVIFYLSICFLFFF